MEKLYTQLSENERRQTGIKHIEGELDPNIIKDEVIYVWNTLKNRKAEGPDQLAVKIPILIKED